MRHFLLFIIIALTAGWLGAGQAIGEDLDGDRTPSVQEGGMAEVGDTDFLPLNRSQILEMQRILVERGYDPGDVNGYIGSDTREAIREFQLAEGLDVTGNPNEKTLRALAPPEKQEFFGLAPEFGGETQNPTGKGSMEGY